MATGGPSTPARRRRGRDRLVAAVAALTLTAVVVFGVAAVRRPSQRPAARPPATAPTAGAAGTAPGAAAAPDGRPGELTSGPLMASSPPVRVSIPALRVDAATVPLGLGADGAMQVPQNGTDIGWYTRAPAPGALGPAVLAAHVDWKGRPGSFHDLADLTPGAVVDVARADGSTAVFAVTRIERHPKDDFPSAAVYGPTDHAALRLITCGGDFDAARRSYRDNVIVYARLAHAREG
ncbi:class F sortase [Micromonospora cathayae]|uniref:Class F sortase n=1 Tax=Micromonospora cathayae TaxID=3028804 RepID=A0ABY7ZK61_9ACTN|nr:class F sortase [Micromonospora sp. HUAS 3]WDZ83374.1 class F sortase [Micromonospora sp. HUAS 3]